MCRVMVGKGFRVGVWGGLFGFEYVELKVFFLRGFGFFGGIDVG